MMRQRITVSEVIKSKSENSDEPQKRSREDWRKEKELEEARKAGTAPAAVDEEGKDINPHIPQYISSLPWYYGNQGPTLKHQRIQPDTIPKHAGIDEWYKRGVSTVKATKFRPGACENCGAMTHNKKECFERPRKLGAKFTNSGIAADEFVQPVLNQSWDGKRDRWAGYDASEYKMVVERFQKIEDAKRALRAEKLAENDETLDDEDLAENEDEDDEDKYADGVDMPGTKVDSKQRITVRNLRIREDTAKYLRNLDPDSAYYDPKTRSMRDNPHKGKDPEEVDYAGENFIRYSGDTSKHARAQLFAWEAHGKGVDVHLLAEPTKLEKLKQEYESKKDEFKHRVQEKVLNKYGGEEHLKVPPKELLLAQTEEYREYTRYGKVLKGEEKPVIRSRYEEDIYPNNHTSVFGSFWHNGHWGYKCCHNTEKNSYCTGEVGKATLPEVASQRFIQQSLQSSSDESESSSSSSSSDSSSSSSESENETENENSKRKEKKLTKKKSDKEKSGKIDEEKLKEALKREEESKKCVTDERKRKYNSMYEAKEPTAEEMEAFMMKRSRDDDPMNYMK